MTELKVNDTIVFLLNNFWDIGNKNGIIGAEIDNTHIAKVTNDKKIPLDNYQDYTIGLLFDIDNFIPPATFLNFKKKKDKYISPKIYDKIHKKYIRFQIPFKRIKLYGKIIKIDSNKKFIDVGIGKYYKLEIDH